MERQLAELAGAMGIAERVLQSPMFLCAREDFADFLRGRKKPQMAAFYKLQRTRLDVLIERDGGPRGGRWSFDEDNRKNSPKTFSPQRCLGSKRTRWLQRYGNWWNSSLAVTQGR